MQIKKSSIRSILVILFLSLVITTCGVFSSAPAEVTVVVPQTVEVTRLVEVVVTATPAQATITPLTTVQPTDSGTAAPVEPGAATPADFSNPNFGAGMTGELLNGLSGWCMPLGYGKPDDTDFGQAGMPKYTRPGFVDRDRSVVHIPGDFCTLVFQFSAPATQGATVEVKQVHNNLTFYSKPLIVSGSDPYVGYVHLDHTYIVNPPLWAVLYIVEVIDPGGAVRWSGEVWFEKTIPEPCWDGSTVDPVTLLCPKYDW